MERNDYALMASHQERRCHNTAYATGPIKTAQVMDDCAHEDLLDGKLADLAVVYGALNGDGFGDAVSLTLAQVGDSVFTRHFEWGRRP
ncbi:MAG: hypothetical protein ACK522_09180 [Synechococcaceae cyanobacterium]